MDPLVKQNWLLEQLELLTVKLLNVDAQKDPKRKLQR
jgi:hypothetical protein